MATRYQSTQSFGAQGPDTSSTSSLLHGGLAGILAGSVFGGPIGAAIGVASGLLSERLRRSELDMAADNAASIADYGTSVQQQIDQTMAYAQPQNPDGTGGFGDPSGSDVKQLESMRERARRATRLAESPDLQLRNAGVQELGAISNEFTGWHGELEKRTQKLADDHTAMLSQMGQHYQSVIEKGQSDVRSLKADTDNARYLLQNAGAESPQTRIALMNLMNSGAREANMDADSFSIGIPGASLSMDFNKFKPTYSEALKIIEGVEKNKLNAINQHVQQTVEQAKQYGFVFAPNEDGSITVHNINTVVQDFQNAKPTGTQRGNSPTASPTDRIDEVPDVSPYTPEDINSKISLPEEMFKDVMDWVQETQTGFKNWANTNLRNSRKRPTN